MKRIILLFISVLAICGGSMEAKDIRKVVLTTSPEMHCHNCETKIKNHLKFEKGIKKIETSVENQTVTVTYDADKTSEDAIINAFPKIKYEAKKVSTDKNATQCKSDSCSVSGSCH